MAKTDTPPVGLSEKLRYDPGTGVFYWLTATHGNGGAIAVGDAAGTPKDGYVNLHLSGISYRAHRVAWYVMTGEWLPSSQDIDHKNRIRSDNRWDNLRLATRSVNSHNASRDYGGQSRVRGVHFAGGRAQKWEARITVSGKLHILGQFQSFDAAVAARKDAEIKFLGVPTPA